MADVWLFFPESRRHDTAKLRLAIRRICQSPERAWDYQERPSRQRRLPGGRKISLIEPEVADQVYRRLHLTEVAVLSIDNHDVCLHPDAVQAEQHTRYRRGLRAFVLHKAYFSILRVPDSTADGWLSNFVAWRDSRGCEDQRDPRVLPHHVFAAEDPHVQALATDAGRVDFDKKYGHGSERVDLDERRWKLNPRDFHGRETLAVAGAKLPRGFHWDVHSARSGSRVVTCREVWQVDGYLNVYPDAQVRGTSSSKRLLPR